MKKFYTYFMAALAVVFVLVACNNTPNEPDQPGDDPTDTIPGGDTLININDNAKLILGAWMQDSSVVEEDGEFYEEEGFAGGRTDFHADLTFKMYDNAAATELAMQGNYTLVGPTLMLDYYVDGELVGSNLFSIMQLDQEILTLRAVYDTRVATYYFSRTK